MAVSHLIIPFVRRRSSVIVVARASSDEIDASTHRRTCNPYSMLGQTIWQRCRTHSSTLPFPFHSHALSLSFSPICYLSNISHPTEHLRSSLFHLCEKSVVLRLAVARGQSGKRKPRPGVPSLHARFLNQSRQSRRDACCFSSLLPSIDRSPIDRDSVRRSSRFVTISNEFSMFERDGFYR